MRQVKVHFNLVGTTRQFTRSLPRQERDSIPNEAILDQIKEQVKFHFGNRAVFIHNEESLLNGSAYPNYYAANWFVSEDSEKNGTDMIVVGHGDSMESAQHMALEAVKTVGWDSLASSY